MIKFDLPKNQSSIIKVMGVGGGGSNAVSHMYNEGIRGVDFILCNTDIQAMDASPVPNKLQLGNKGLGAGSIPAVGRDSALEKTEEIKEMLEKNTQNAVYYCRYGWWHRYGSCSGYCKYCQRTRYLP